MRIFPQRENDFQNIYFVSNLDQMEKNYCPRRPEHFDNAVCQFNYTSLFVMSRSNADIHDWLHHERQLGV